MESVCISTNCKLYPMCANAQGSGPSVDWMRYGMGGSHISEQRQTPACGPSANYALFTPLKEGTVMRIGNDAILSLNSPDSLSQLKTLRTARGMSQVELSQRTGIDAATISLIESGKRNPTLKTLCAILSALGYELNIIGKESIVPQPALLPLQAEN